MLRSIFSSESFIFLSYILLNLRALSNLYAIHMQSSWQLPKSGIHSCQLAATIEDVRKSYFPVKQEVENIKCDLH